MIWYTYAQSNDRRAHTDYYSSLHTPQTLACQNLLIAWLSACPLDRHLPADFQTCAMALCSTECGCFTVKSHRLVISLPCIHHIISDRIPPFHGWVSFLACISPFLCLFICQRLLGWFLMIVNNSVRHGGAYITLRYQLHSLYIFSQ